MYFNFKFSKILTETIDDSSCNARIVRVAVIPGRRQCPDSLSKLITSEIDLQCFCNESKLTFRRGAASRWCDTTQIQINQSVIRKLFAVKEKILHADGPTIMNFTSGILKSRQRQYDPREKKKDGVQRTHLPVAFAACRQSACATHSDEPWSRKWG